MKLIDDVRAIRRNDPACRGLQFLLYPSFHSMVFHRILCHPLYKMKCYFMARFFSQVSRWFTGLEVHPGAKIEAGFFCDHGMGVVIGETAEIGLNCVMFHGVTLGGTGKHDTKRHPTLGANIFVGTHSTLLGPIHIGDNARIGAETVIINRDVPANATVVGTPGYIVKWNGKKIDPPQLLPVASYRVTEVLNEAEQDRQNYVQYPDYQI